MTDSATSLSSTSSTPEDSSPLSYVTFKSESLQFPSSHDTKEDESLVFFDPSREQIFIIHYIGKSAKVSMLCLKDENLNFTFVLPDTNSVTSVKLSPDSSTLSIQRTASAVEFFDVATKCTRSAFSQISRSRGRSPILAFYWLYDCNLLFITSTTIELYRVDTQRKKCIEVKYYNVTFDWFVFSSEVKCLVLHSVNDKHLQTFYFRNPDDVTRCSKINLQPTAHKLSEHDISIVNVYGLIFVMRTKGHVLRGSRSCAEIEMYLVSKEIITMPTCVLHLNSVGSFATSVFDNLIILHHRESQTCSVFDILHHSRLRPTSALNTNENRNMSVSGLSSVSGINNLASSKVAVHRSVAPPFKPLIDNNNETLYNSSWVGFPPNTIIDTDAGHIYKVTVDLSLIVEQIYDLTDRVDFLMRRSYSKSHLIECLYHATEDCYRNNEITNLENCFCYLADALLYFKENDNDVVTAHYSYIQNEIRNIGVFVDESEFPPTPSTIKNVEELPMLTQQELHIHIFQRLEKISKTPQSSKVLSSLILGLFYALEERDLVVATFLELLLIRLFATQKDFSMLHNCIQYHMFRDSKEVASAILSLKDVYAPAKQLGFDMYYRLQISNLDIVELQLSTNEVIAALKFASQHKIWLPTERFLEAIDRNSIVNDEIFMISIRAYESLSSDFNKNLKSKDL